MPKFCTKCGTPLHGAAFCSECGYKHEAEQSVQEAAQQPVQAQPQATPRAVSYPLQPQPAQAAPPVFPQPHSNTPQVATPPQPPSQPQPSAQQPPSNKNKIIGAVVAACLVVGAAVAVYMFDPFDWFNKNENAPENPGSIAAATPALPNESDTPGGENSRQQAFDDLLTDGEREFIKNNPYIQIAGIPGDSPISFYNSDTGQWEGIYFDLLEEIEDLSGLQFILTNDEHAYRNDLLEMLLDGEVSLMPGHSSIVANEGIGAVFWYHEHVYEVLSSIVSKSMSLTNVDSVFEKWAISGADQSLDNNTGGGTATDLNANNQQRGDYPVTGIEADLFGFWQTEWIMADGSEVIMDVAFGKFGEFYMMVGYKYSEPMSQIEGDFEVRGDTLVVQGIDYIYAEPYDREFDFRFKDNTLYINVGDADRTFTRARTPPYEIFFNVT